MKFVPSSNIRLLRYTLFLSTQISAETAAEEMSIFTTSHESSYSKELRCRLTTPGNFIANVIFVIEIIITPNAME